MVGAPSVARAAEGAVPARPVIHFISGASLAPEMLDGNWLLRRSKVAPFGFGGPSHFAGEDETITALAAIDSRSIKRKAPACVRGGIWRIALAMWRELTVLTPALSYDWSSLGVG